MDHHVDWWPRDMNNHVDWWPRDVNHHVDWWPRDVIFFIQQRVYLLFLCQTT